MVKVKSVQIRKTTVDDEREKVHAEECTRILNRLTILEQKVNQIEHELVDTRNKVNRDESN